MNWNKLFHNMKDGTVIMAVLYLFAKGLPIIRMVERFELNIKQTDGIYITLKDHELRVNSLEKFQDRYTDRMVSLEQKLKSMDEKLDIIIGLRSYRK